MFSQSPLSSATIADCCFRVKLEKSVEERALVIYEVKLFPYGLSFPVNLSIVRQASIHFIQKSILQSLHLYPSIFSDW